MQTNDKRNKEGCSFLDLSQCKNVEAWNQKWPTFKARLSVKLSCDNEFPLNENKISFSHQ